MQNKIQKGERKERKSKGKETACVQEYLRGGLGAEISRLSIAAFNLPDISDIPVVQTRLSFNLSTRQHLVDPQGPYWLQPSSCFLCQLRHL